MTCKSNVYLGFCIVQHSIVFAILTNSYFNLGDVYHRDGLYYREDWEVWKVSVARLLTDSVCWDNLCLADIRKIWSWNEHPTNPTFSVHQLHPARGGLLVQPGQPPAGLRGEVGLQGQSDQGGHQLHRPLPHVHRGIWQYYSVLQVSK